MTRLFRETKLIWAGIGLGILYWFLESLIHTFVFQDRNFIQQLFNPVPHEMWMRSLITSLLIGLGFYAQFKVTEQRKAEETTKKAHTELDQVFNTAADGMRIIDKDFNVLRVNDTFMSLAKMSDDTVGTKCYETFYSPRCHSSNCSLIQILQGEERVEYEDERQCVDGSKGFFIVSATPFRGTDGELMGIVEDFKDITERKEFEEALQTALQKAENEKIKSEAVLKSMGNAVSIVDTNFRFIYQNRVHREEYGEHIGEFCYKAIKNREQICEGCPVEESFTDGEIHAKERVVRTEEGTKYVKNTASPLRDSSGKIVAGIESIVDITEQREAEEATKKAHAELDQIFNTAADGMRVIDKDFNVLRVNDTFATLSGVSRDELMEKKCYEVFNSPRCHTNQCSLNQILEKEDKVEYEDERKHMDGVEVHCIVTATPFRGTDGELMGIVEDFKDITDLRRLNNLLQSVSEINEVLAREKEPENVMDALCGKLNSLYECVSTSVMKDGELIPVRSEGISIEYINSVIDKCPSVSRAMEGKVAKMATDSKLCRQCSGIPHNYVLSIPLIYEEQQGVITIHSNSDFSDKEIGLLEKLASNIAFALAACKVEKDKEVAMNQLIKNVAQFDRFADRLRNPLAIIMSTIELRGYYREEQVIETIQEQAKRIEEELDTLRGEETSTFELLD